MADPKKALYDVRKRYGLATDEKVEKTEREKTRTAKPAAFAQRTNGRNPRTALADVRKRYGLYDDKDTQKKGGLSYDEFSGVMRGLRNYKNNGNDDAAYSLFNEYSDRMSEGQKADAHRVFESQYKTPTTGPVEKNSNKYLQQAKNADKKTIATGNGAKGNGYVSVADFKRVDNAQLRKDAAQKAVNDVVGAYGNSSTSDPELIQSALAEKRAADAEYEEAHKKFYGMTPAEQTAAERKARPWYEKILDQDEHIDFWARVLNGDWLTKGNQIYDTQYEENKADIEEKAAADYEAWLKNAVETDGRVKTANSNLDKTAENLKILDNRLLELQAELQTNPSEELYTEYATTYITWQQGVAFYNKQAEDLSAVWDTVVNEKIEEGRNSDATGWDVAKYTGVSGINGIARAGWATLDFLLPTEFLGKYDYISKWNNENKATYDYWERMRQESLEGKGKAAQWASDLGVAAIEMLPTTVVALLSGGASLMGSANTLAAGGGAAATGWLGTTMQSAKTVVSNMLKNPAYYTSAAMTLGRDYEDAKADGASDSVAAVYAILTTALNAGIEMGGVETIPKAVREGGKPLLLWLMSMPSEGLEEVAQGITSGTMQKAFYDHDKAVFSTTDEDAIIHPKTMGKEFAMGTALGGFMGGIETGASVVLDNANKKRLAEVGKKVRPNVEAYVSEGIKYGEGTAAFDKATEIKTKMDGGEEVTDVELGELAYTNQQAQTNQFTNIILDDQESMNALIESGKENGGKAAKLAAKMEEEMSKGERVTREKVQSLMQENQKANTKEMLGGRKNGTVGSMYEGAEAELVETALDLNPESEAYRLGQAAADKLAAGESLTAGETGALARANEKAMAQEQDVMAEMGLGTEPAQARDSLAAAAQDVVDSKMATGLSSGTPIQIQAAYDAGRTDATGTVKVAENGEVGYTQNENVDTVPKKRNPRTAEERAATRKKQIEQILNIVSYQSEERQQYLREAYEKHKDVLEGAAIGDILYTGDNYAVGRVITNDEYGLSIVGDDGFIEIIPHGTYAQDTAVDSILETGGYFAAENAAPGTEGVSSASVYQGESVRTAPGEVNKFTEFDADGNPVYASNREEAGIEAYDHLAMKQARAEADKKYDITLEEGRSLAGYTQLTYRIMNDRMQNDTLRNGDQAVIDRVLSALKKFPPFEGKTYRNLKFNTEEQYNDFLEKHAAGKTVTLKSFTSTSKRPNGYPLFGNRVVHMVIASKTGADIADTYGIPRQQEVILLPGTEIENTSVTTANDGHPLIFAQEVAAHGVETDHGDARPARSVKADRKEDRGGEPVAPGDGGQSRGVRAEARDHDGRDGVLSERGESDHGGAVPVNESVPADVQAVASTLGANGSKMLMKAYETVKGSVDAKTAAGYFREVYNAALKNENLDAVKKLAEGKIPSAMIELAEQAGKDDALRALTAKHWGEEAGLKQDKNFRKSRINSKQARILDAVGKALGVKIVIDPSIKVKGKSAAGLYVDADGTIHLAADTANPVEAVFNHEIIHRLRVASPEAYMELAAFVMENADRSTLLGLRLLESKKDKELDADGTYEEVVANAFGRLMADKALLEQFAAQCPESAHKIRDAIRDIVVKIREFLHGAADMSQHNAELAAYKELGLDLEAMEQKLSQALDKAQADAKRNREKTAGMTRTVAKDGTVTLTDANGKVVAETKNTAGVGGGKAMIDNAAGVLDEYSDWRRATLENVEGNVIVENEQQLYDLVQEAFENRQSKKSLHLGVVPQLALDRIEKEIVGLPADLRGKLFKANRDQSLEIGQEDIRHLVDEKASMTRQDAYEYVSKLPLIVTQFDEVQFFYYDKGQNRSRALRFIKQLPDGKYISFEVVSRKKNQLETHNIFMDSADYTQKKKHATPMPVPMAQGKTSKTLGGYASSTDSILEPSENSNPKSSLQLTEAEAAEQAEFMKEWKRKTKEMTPAEIANLTIEDANAVYDGLKIKKTEKHGDKESSFYGSVQDSDNVLFQTRELAKTAEDIRYYQGISNEETLEKANEALNTRGRNESERFLALKKDEATAQDVALGFILLKRYQDAGQYEGAVRIIQKLREIGTAAGQTVQTFSLLGRMTPEGMACYAQTELDKARERMVKKNGEEWAEKRKEMFLLTEEELRFIRQNIEKASRLPEGRDKNILLAEIATLIQNKMPTNVGRMLKGLARESMLLNPKTLVRNVSGNVLMMPTYVVQDFIGSGIDRALAKQSGVRTTGITLPNKAALAAAKKGVYESYDDWRRQVNTKNVSGDRFEIGQGPAFTHYSKEQRRSVNLLKRSGMWASNAFHGLDRLMGFLLEVGDRPFFEYHFINALNNQLRLNGVEEATEEMVQIATTEALSRTWQDDNKVTKAAQGVVRIFNGGGEYGFGSVLVPFVKTPANLTKALIEHSPAALVTVVARKAVLYNRSRKSQHFDPKTQKAFVDSLSKAITGTLVMVIGGFLAAAGVITGGDDDKDKDLKDFEKNVMGIAPYSVVVDGKSYTYDWAQPVGSLTAITADVVQAVKSGDGMDLTEDVLPAAGNIILEALKTGGNVLYEQSFLQGISDLFSEDDLMSGLIDAVFGWPTQFMATALSQIAQMADPYARTTYEYKKTLHTAKNKVMAKIPGLRNKLANVVDVLGHDVLSYGGENNVWNVFFNPTNIYAETATAAAKEIYRVYGETGETAVIPRKAPYYVEYEKQRYNFTSYERADVQRVMGQTTENAVNDLLKNAGYASLSDEEKAKVLEKIVGYSAQVGKKTYLKGQKVSYEMSDPWMEEALEAEKKYGIPMGVYVLLHCQTTEVKGIPGKNGRSIDNSKGLQTMQIVYDTPGLTEKQRSALFEYLGVGEKIRHWNKARVNDELAKMQEKAG